VDNNFKRNTSQHELSAAKLDDDFCSVGVCLWQIHLVQKTWQRRPGTWVQAPIIVITTFVLLTNMFEVK